MGDLSRVETAITVTGLKSSHFYNVRVIAVGSNNFQAGSRVVRLRTYGRDGRPDLGISRFPVNVPIEDVQNGAFVDSSDDSVGIRSHGLVGAATLEGGSGPTRDPTSGHTSQKRYSAGMKHSPSTTSERRTPLNTTTRDADETMERLTGRFEMIRGETEEVIAQMSRDAEDFQTQMAELSKERDEKRQALREKEDASEKLRKEAHYSERSNRQAQNRKSQKEKALREKQAERTKMLEDSIRWQEEIEDMLREEESWEKEKEKIKKATGKKIEGLQNTLRKRQNSLSSMEEEIRIKGLQIKELEEERQKLPGVEDSEGSRERDAAERQRDILWEQKERDLIARNNNSAIILRNLESDIQKAQAYLLQISTRQASNSVMYNGNSSGVDFDHNGQGRPKTRRSRHRRSRTNTVSSPIASHPITDSNFASASPYKNIVSPTAFTTSSYFDMSSSTSLAQLVERSGGMSESDIRLLNTCAPLSPTATSLLPSNIFSDDETPHRSSSFRPAFVGIGPPAFENDPQSPASSSCSTSLISSPQTSSHNLPLFPTIRETGNATDRRSIHSPVAEFGVIGSPSISSAQPAPSKRFGDLFSLSRQRGKNIQSDGPMLGSLKPRQSQSFPRKGDEPETLAMRNRRTSFSTSWAGLSFLNRSGTGGEVTEGNGPAPARNTARKRKGFNMFGSSYDDPISVYSERDPSSPRPASIASSDFPRPSTDSPPFGWPVVENLVVSRNCSLATNWSLNLSQPWSGNHSRRQSAQHGSTSALSTGIATDDDEFLPPDTLTQQTSPPQVGVIGTRPQSSKSATALPKLNPNAPTFKAMFGRSSKTEKDKSDKPEKTKGKGRAKESSESMDDHGAVGDLSPSDSRKSRDARSIHTTSVTESHESLDRTASSTTSEIINSRDGRENSFQKLLRKGSSSKFSISSFRGKESLFGSKKGSSANSDRNASGDRSSGFGDTEESDFGRSVDSMTSSPQVGGGTPKEGRMGVNWGRFGLKKSKGGRASMESGERASETEGTEDEERES